MSRQERVKREGVDWGNVFKVSVLGNAGCGEGETGRDAAGRGRALGVLWGEPSLPGGPSAAAASQRRGWRRQPGWVPGPAELQLLQCPLATAARRSSGSSLWHPGTWFGTLGAPSLWHRSFSTLSIALTPFLSPSITLPLPLTPLHHSCPIPVPSPSPSHCPCPLSIPPPSFLPHLPPSLSQQSLRGF